MNREKTKQILERAVKTYGSRAQMDMMIEEMSELTKALLKLRRAHDEAETEKVCENIREEMADVQIMLLQMELIFGRTTEVMGKKLERLEQRLKESYVQEDLSGTDDLLLTFLPESGIFSSSKKHRIKVEKCL